MESFLLAIAPLTCVLIVGGSVIFLALIGFLIYFLDKHLKNKSKDKIEVSDSASNLASSVFGERDTREAKKREIKTLTKERNDELNKIVQDGKMKAINAKNFRNNNSMEDKN